MCWPPPIPTLRAVFAEDAAALTGLVIAATGLALHQITGSATPDAIGSILVGVLLGVVAVVLINRNRQFLVGQEVSPAARSAALTALLDLPDVDRVTALRLEFIGPRQVYLVADVDLTGDDSETAPGDPAARPGGQDPAIAGGGGLHPEPVGTGRAGAGSLMQHATASAVG